MICKTEADLLRFAESIGKSLTPPAVFELIGDVGAGKTTFTRGLARGLGVREPVTSPSFSISKRYPFSRICSAEPIRDASREATPVAANASKPTAKSASKPTGQPAPCELIHYDFYRLSEPGLMSFELAEALSAPNSVVVIEWGDSIQDLLPPYARTFRFSILADGSREIAEEAREEGRESNLATSQPTNHSQG